MAPKPILRDRRMLLLPLPLLLFLIALEVIFTWFFCCVLRADCSGTLHDLLDRTKVPEHRHVLTFALDILFGHVDITQCEQCFAIIALLSGFVHRSAAFSHY